MASQEFLDFRLARRLTHFHGLLAHLPPLCSSNADLGRCRRLWHWQVGTVAYAAILGIVCVATAGDAPQGLNARISFNIREQPLVTALQAYSAATGVQVLYESEIAVGRRSAATRGEFTREVALKTLLGDSDLVVRYTRPDAITLVDPSTAKFDGPPPFALSAPDMALDTLHVRAAAGAADRNALADYVSAIQQDIQDTLKKSAKTRSGSYRIGMDLWVDPSRTVRRADVFRSTGDHERDAAIAGALQGLVVRQAAPANTPQPVRVMVIVRSL